MKKSYFERPFGRHSGRASIVAAVMSIIYISPSVHSAPLIANPNVLVNQHVDLNIVYAGGAWGLDPRDDDNGGISYASHQALLHVNSTSLMSVPSGFDFIGAGVGGSAYVLPQSQNPELLYLGFAGYGATPTGQFDRYNPSVESSGRVSGYGRWLKVSLDSVKGPGDFSVWQSGDVGPNVFMSTASGGVTSSDALWIVAGGHIHYNFGFTRRGLYQVNVLTSGYLGDDGLTTPNTAGYTQAAAPISLYFNVDPGYATSGMVASSSLPQVGSASVAGMRYYESTLAGSPDRGAVRVDGVELIGPVWVLLDLADAEGVGALTVALSGFDPDQDGYSEEPNQYGLLDVAATAIVDNSILADHPGFDLALRYDVAPGGSFDFEFDYSMILDGVRIDRVGLHATSVVVPEPGVLSVLLPGALFLLGRRSSSTRTRD